MYDMIRRDDIVVVSLKRGKMLFVFDYYVGNSECVVSEKTNRNEKYKFNIADVKKANSDEKNKIMYL